jgi:hypothetical protein
VRHDAPADGFLGQFPRDPVAHRTFRGGRLLAGQRHDLHDLLRGKDARRARTRLVGQQSEHQVGEFRIVLTGGFDGGQGGLGLRPALAPAAHGLTGQVEALSDLLILVREDGGGQYELGAPDLPLRAGLAADDALEDGLLARRDDDNDGCRAGHSGGMLLRQ